MAPQLEVPLSLARMQPDYIRTVGIMSSRPTNCRDHTIHATISPYIPNTYALVGDQGRVAIWTRRSAGSNTSRYVQESTDVVAIVRKHDNAPNDQQDPWRSCIWSAHPSNLIVTSRTHMELVDYRVCSPCTTKPGRRWLSLSQQKLTMVCLLFQTGPNCNDIAI